ncbi:MAG: indolepyruvate oxidoreductase subunit beta [Rhodospirillales bacterium]
MMDNRVINVVIAGLGGQGVIRASDIAAGAAFRSGFDVKKSEIHGMSQRGGFVTSDVRFGRQVSSPMVPKGEADYLVVLAPDQLEAVRGSLRPGGVLILPDGLNGEPLPNKKTLNVALLGILSAHLPIPEANWVEAIRSSLPEKFHEANLHAFQLGRRQATEHT